MTHQSSNTIYFTPSLLFDANPLISLSDLFHAAHPNSIDLNWFAYLPDRLCES